MCSKWGVGARPRTHRGDSSPEFIIEVRAHIGSVIDEQNVAERLLHKQLTTELQALDTREDNLIELAADATTPQPKIKAKLREIARDRQRLTERMTTTTENLSDSARLIEVALELLEDPQELCRRCNDQQRRMLNQTIFHALYIDDEQITDHSLREPFGRLHAIQHTQQTEHPTPATDANPRPAEINNATASQRSGGVDVLLHGIDLAPCSSKPRWS